MRTLLLSILVGIPTGIAGSYLGHLWDKFVTSRGWPGWEIPEMTEEERREWGL